MADRMKPIFIAFGLLVLASTAAAETFPDPTRPPAGLIGGDAVAKSGGAVAKQPSGLQSTIVSKSRRAAIIDGKTVELWGMHGKEQLIEVNEGRVVLKGARGSRVLTLFPDISMAKSGSQPLATGEKK